MRISIKKFKRAEDVNFDVPVIIHGGNGLNKTTILEAISFCLTGKNLNGKEFAEIYDNRVDLHDAIADVTFTDNYGNSYRRVVMPKFTITRQGEEKLSVLRNTQCYKNTIECNDYAEVFSDFLKYGTDYFFLQSQDDQRKSFIALLKNELPDFNLTEKSAELKQLKRAQKAERDAIEAINIDKIMDVEVPEITIDDTLYQNALSGSTSEQAISAQKENQRLLNERNTERSLLLNRSNDILAKTLSVKSKVTEKRMELEAVEKSECVAGAMHDIEEIENSLLRNKEVLSKLTYFNDLSEVFTANSEHPVIKENVSKIESISALTFENSEMPELAAALRAKGECEYIDEHCKVVEDFFEKAKLSRFREEKESKIADLKFANRQILTKIMLDNNTLYLSVKAKVESIEKTLTDTIAENEEISARNSKELRIFEDSKKLRILSLNNELKTLSNEIISLEAEMDKVSSEIKILESTPIAYVTVENNIISDELKEQHRLFEAQKLAKTDAEAINRNNARLRKEKEDEKEARRNALYEISEKITKIQQEISDYFANLADVVKEKFDGDYKIELKLQEYVIRTDDYKDCFIITADGKKFPHECNGAMVNNVKCQILNGLQKLAKYDGITVIDNAEANTTMPLNTLTLKAVVAMATKEDLLTFK